VVVILLLRLVMILQLGVDFRHDPVARLEQEETDFLAAHVSVKRRDLVVDR
jgi:hypothetical protein